MEYLVIHSIPGRDRCPIRHWSRAQQGTYLLFAAGVSTVDLPLPLILNTNLTESMDCNASSSDSEITGRDTVMTCTLSVKLELFELMTWALTRIGRMNLHREESQDNN